jgi:Na+/H+ antiporter NhaD/arsenite permease-like protein
VLVNIAGSTGLFQYIAIKGAKLVRGNPIAIIILLSVMTGTISAFLDNVTTIVILTPIAILIAVELGLHPGIFVIAITAASNIGGTATLIGDPPNIMIGFNAGLTFGDFLRHMMPLIVLIGIASIGLTVLLFRGRLTTTSERRARIMSFDESTAIKNKVMVAKTLFVWLLVIAGFVFQDFTGISPTVVAMSGAALLLMITGAKPEKYLAEIEWVTIFFFIGLFILVGTLEEQGVITAIGKALLGVADGNRTITAFTILWGSGLLSGIVDNIPFVAAMIPLIKIINQDMAFGGNVLWWALSSGACLGGNLTLIGASANVVATEIAKRSGYPVSFWEFTKYGVLYTLLSLAISSLYLYVRYLAF